ICVGSIVEYTKRITTRTVYLLVGNGALSKAARQHVNEVVGMPAEWPPQSGIERPTLPGCSAVPPPSLASPAAPCRRRRGPPGPPPLAPLLPLLGHIMG